MKYFNIWYAVTVLFIVSMTLMYGIASCPVKPCSINWIGMGYAFFPAMIAYHGVYSVVYIWKS